MLRSVMRAPLSTHILPLLQRCPSPSCTLFLNQCKLRGQIPLVGFPVVVTNVKWETPVARVRRVIPMFCLPVVVVAVVIIDDDLLPVSTHT